MNARPRSPLLDCGVASRALPGQSASGDLSLLLPFPGGTLVAAIDGVGHGAEAAAAARAAGDVLAADPAASVIWLVRRCHDKLLETRGVVMSLASFSAGDSTVTWIGVGNVEGRLLRADTALNPSREALLLRGGVVGFNLPQLAASVLPVARGDTLIFATDGIHSGFGERLQAGAPPQLLAEQILAQHAKPTDDALAIVAVFQGNGA